MASAPTSLLPCSAPMTAPLAAWPRSPPTCDAPSMTPVVTSVTAPVSALPTLPVFFRAAASDPLTVSVTALTISPVPLMVSMFHS